MTATPAQSEQHIIGNRYQLHDQIGVGGMGAVYRATDRLSGQTLALKRVTISTLQLEFASQAPGRIGVNYRVALAREFKTLASLHHPHIINVLDYGFDTGDQPYFTMDLLQDAQTIVDAGRGQALATRVAYLVQTLQALAYLHRRGIIHRDLKPSNVLVTPADGQAHVLDFGLAAQRQAAQGRVGTLHYMSPEVIRKGEANEASDLYAVGVMAYELFVGYHPFQAQGEWTLSDVLQSEPDVSSLLEAMRPIIAKLLLGDPAARYQDAQQVIWELSAAAGLPAPQESIAIRESFLQAAQFVGREAEFEQLSDALAQAMRGQGSAWLVGGESGVGKSRLLDELRIQALVYRVRVLRGQASEEDAAPYQLWRDVVRRLALSTALSELQAGVLQALAPDIETLLGRPIPQAPELEASAAHQRVLSTVADVICSAAQESQPVLLILEDLQWAPGSGEGLELLRHLNRVVAAQPLLIVASFRDDERPALPDELPGMRRLSLQRLTEQDVVNLSASMLGEPGRRSHVVELLQEETEGNAFFLVEVVRALAEEAGQLGNVGLATLPGTVFTRGIHNIIQRRLGRVPPGDRPLLELAAVAGRALDLDVLRVSSPHTDLDAWLTTVANVAVLEVRGGQWRFSHDKLREGVLNELAPEKRAALHRQVAGAVESIYPGDPDQAATLAHHWRAAGDSAQERRYARVAGEHALARHAHDEALVHLTRALTLALPDDLPERYELLQMRAQVLGLQGERGAQADDLASLAETATALDDPHRQAEAALLQSDYAINISDYPGAIAAAQRAIALGEQTQAMDLVARGELAWGKALVRQGQYAQAQAQYERALPVLRKLGTGRQVAEALTAWGSVLTRQSEYVSARSKLEQALQVSREIGDRQVQGKILNQLGILIAWQQGDYDLVRTHYQDALRIFQEIGFRRGEAIILNNLGSIARNLGEYDRALAYLQQSLPLYQEIGYREGVGTTLGNLGLTWHFLGDCSQAQTRLQQALHIVQEIGNQPLEGLVLCYLGGVLIDLEEFEQAETCLQQALYIQQEIGERQIEGLTLDNLGWLAYARGDYAQADVYYEQARTLNQEIEQTIQAIAALAGLARSALAQGDLAGARAYVNEILVDLESNPTLDGLDFSSRVFQTCIQVLQAAQDPQADEFLNTAHALLQERAVQIADDDMRRSFLENVTSHREIVSAWQKKQGKQNG